MSIWMSKIIEAAKKRKQTAEPKHQPTATSSPLRGANQDYSGVGVKHDTTDYTISDETHPMPPAPEWEKTTPAFRRKHAKHLVKVTSMGTHGKGPTPVAEVVAGVGSVRSTPITMKTSSHTGGSNAPAAAKSMQRAADVRRQQLDKAAQQEREKQKKDAEQQQKQREAAAAKRAQAEAPKPTAPGQAGKAHLEDKMLSFLQFTSELNEKRGRPKKGETPGSDQEDTGNQHPIMQMRKVISTRGQHKVTFKDGSSHEVSPATAHKVIAHHDNLSRPADKEAFASHIAKSKEHMHAALAGKKEAPKPKVSLAGKITGTQK